MSHQFLKKKFSFTRLFLRFFGILIFSLSITVNVYAASPLTSLYENVINQPFPKAKTKVETKNTVVTSKTNIFTQLSTFLDKYYDSYTSGLALVLYPVKTQPPTSPLTGGQTSTTITSPDKGRQGGVVASQPEPTGLAVVTTPSTLASLKTVVTPSSPQTKIVYIPGPKGDTGPQGPQGLKGDAGLTSFGSTITSSSPNPVAYMPVGITIPNPSQNFTGGEYASIANLTSNLFTNNTSNIITLNVSGNQTVTGNSSVGGTFNVTGATTLSGNLNVTGTITGSVTGAMNPALTNGSVFFQDTAGISQDNANFFYDKTNHRLGLGTTTPDSTLVLRPSGGAPVLNVFSNLGTNALYVANNGNVAIGTIAAVAKLSVAGDVSFGVIDTFHYDQNNRQLRLGYDPSNYDTFTTTSNGSLTVAATGTNPNITLTPGGTGYTILNGNVGIGTTTAPDALTVSGYVRALGGGIRLDNNQTIQIKDTVGSYQSIFGLGADNATYVNIAGTAGASRNFYLYDIASSTPRVTVNGSSGNVGIGTTTPLTLLHLQQSSVGASAARIFLKNSAANTVGNATDLTFGSSSSFTDGTYSGRIQSVVTNAGNLASDMTFGVYNGTSDIEALRILSTGNVGIGTTAPGAKLDVRGDINILTTTNQGGLSVSATAANQASIYIRESDVASADWRITNITKDLRFQDGTGADRVTLKDGGNVGIGTTAPTATLHVVGTTNLGGGFTLNSLGKFSQAAFYPDGNNTRTLGGSSQNWAQVWTNSLIVNETTAIDSSRNATLATAALGGATIGTNALAVTGSAIISGNVGIGTTGPGAKLQVSGSNFQTTFGTVAPTMLVQNTDSTLNALNSIAFQNAGGFYGAQVSYIPTSSATVNTGGALAFATKNTIDGNWTEGMRIINGNVGIGTTAPTVKLQVDHSSTNTVFSSLGVTDIGLSVKNTSSTDGNMSLISFVNAFGAGQGFIGTIFPQAGVVNGGGDLVFGTRQTGGSIGERMRLSNSGNLGIGETSPGRKLVITSSGTGAGSASLALNESGTRQWIIGAGLTTSGRFTIQNGSGGDPLTIDANNNVGIGTSTPVSVLNIANSNSDTTPYNSTAGMISLANSNGTANTYNGINFQSKDSDGATVAGYAGILAQFTNTVGATRSSDLLFYVRNLNSLINPFVIKSSGNVGIGITAPVGKLDIEPSVTSASMTLGSATGIGLALTGTAGNGTFGLYGGVDTGTGNSWLQAGRTNTATAYNLSLQASGGNVGIGTTTPQALLHLKGQNVANRGQLTLEATDYAQLTFYKGGTTATDLGGQIYYDVAANTFRIQNYNNNSFGPLLLNASGGNVGIGTTSPGKLLEVNGNSAGTAQIKVDGGTLGKGYIGNFADSLYLTAGGTYQSGWVGDNVARSIASITLSGATTNSFIGFGTVATDNTAPVERMRIDKSGNVGIGTTGPGTPLDVNGNVSIGAGNRSTSGVLRMPNAGVLSWRNAANTGNISGVRVGGSDELIFGTGFGDTMTLLNTGNVGIGTTSPGVKLDIVGGGIRLDNTQNIGFKDSSGNAGTSMFMWSDNYTYFDNLYDNTGGFYFRTKTGGSVGQKVTILNNGNVGIGTTNPTNLLQVNGGNFYVQTGAMILDAGRKITFDSGGTTRASIRSSASNAKDLTFETNGTDQMVIKSDGNVGIGTTGPLAKLDVRGDPLIYSATTGADYAEGLSVFYTGASPNGGGYNLHLGSAGTAPGVGTLKGYLRVLPTSGDVRLWSYTASNLSLGTNNLERVTIKSDGNVGIGTTAPVSTLGVFTDGTDAIAKGLQLTIADGAIGSSRIGLVTDASRQQAYIKFAKTSSDTSRSGSIAFFTSGGAYGNATSESMRIDPGGNVGIGTTSPNAILNAFGAADTGPSTTVKGIFQVGFGSTNGLSFGSYSSGSFANWIQSIDYRIGQGTTYPLVFNPIGGNVGIGTTAPGAPLEVKGTGTGATIAKFTDVNTTGCAIATGGTIACSSDVRLKKNIENINYGLSTVMQLRPVLYNWNYETDGQTKSLGFIAQEVEALIPKLVATDDQGMKSLNTTGIIPILTKGIQELDLKITDVTNLNGLTGETFFGNLTTKLAEWMANAGNGIGKIFVGEINTENIKTKTSTTESLCVKNDRGETCITRDQLDALLSNFNGNINPPAPAPTPDSAGSPQAPEPAPTPTPDSPDSTTSNPPQTDSTPPAPEVNP